MDDAGFEEIPFGDAHSNGKSAVFCCRQIIRFSGPRLPQLGFLLEGNVFHEAPPTNQNTRNSTLMRVRDFFVFLDPISGRLSPEYGMGFFFGSEYVQPTCCQMFTPQDAIDPRHLLYFFGCIRIGILIHSQHWNRIQFVGSDRQHLSLTVSSLQLAYTLVVSPYIFQGETIPPWALSPALVLYIIISVYFTAALYFSIKITNIKNFTQQLQNSKISQTLRFVHVGVALILVETNRTKLASAEADLVTSCLPSPPA